MSAEFPGAAPAMDDHRPGWSATVLAHYEHALRHGLPLQARGAHGTALRFDTTRWLGPPDAGDETLLARCTGPTLDIGCGPGRLVHALTARGIPALGVDVSGHAVALARAAGAIALRRSVFDRLPGAGRWAVALLADGNIGIGGDPARLLSRLRELLAPGAHALIEVDPDGESTDAPFTAVVSGPDGAALAAFPWTRVGGPSLIAAARPLGYRPTETWTTAGREFMDLVRC